MSSKSFLFLVKYWLLWRSSNIHGFCWTPFSPERLESREWHLDFDVLYVPLPLLSKVERLLILPIPPCGNLSLPCFCIPVFFTASLSTQRWGQKPRSHSSFPLRTDKFHLLASPGGSKIDLGHPLSFYPFPPTVLAQTTIFHLGCAVCSTQSCLLLQGGGALKVHLHLSQRDQSTL